MSECPKAFYCLPESCGDCPRDEQARRDPIIDRYVFERMSPARGMSALVHKDNANAAIVLAVREARAEGERAATERMADDWYEMRDVLQSTVDSLESALRRVEFYEVDRPRKPKQHRTVQRARALLARTADAIERGEHE